MSQKPFERGRIVTRLYHVSAARAADDPAIGRAAEVIREGGLVAFPTETVYGLGADGLNGMAVRGIFAAKGRPSDNPLILHVDGLDGLNKVSDSVPEKARRLVATFWPGPLTLVVPKALCVPTEVTAGLETVAVRCPSHPVARELIRQSGRPIAAPSANLSGRPSPTTAHHVRADLDGRVDIILDSGPTGIGLESTVVDITRTPPMLLRPGGLPIEAVQEVLGELGDATRPKAGEAVRSPGQKYTHYSPAARVILVDCHDKRERLRVMKEKVEDAFLQGLEVGVMCAEETAPEFSGVRHRYVLGSRTRLDQVAARLFAGLRSLDEKHCQLIVAEGFDRTGYGLGIMDRLIRAADEIVGDEEGARD